MSHFRERRNQKDPHATVEKKKKAAAAFEEWYGVEYDAKVKEGGEKSGNSESDSDSDSDSDSMDEDMEDVQPKKVAGSKRKAAEISAEAATEDEEDDEPVVDTSALSKRARVFFENPLFDDAVKVTAGAKRKAETSQTTEKGLFSEEMTGADDSSDDEADIAAMARNRKKRKKGKKGEEEEEGQDNGFEIVTSENLTGGEAETGVYSLTRFLDLIRRLTFGMGQMNTLSTQLLLIRWRNKWFDHQVDGISSMGLSTDMHSTTETIFLIGSCRNRLVLLLLRSNQ